MLFHGCRSPAIHKEPTSREKLILEYISKAVHADYESKEQIKALWELFKLGEEIAGPPEEIWNEGPAVYEKSSQINDSFYGYCYPRISRISDVFYVFYGEGWGGIDTYLCLLSVRNYPDGKKRFAILSGAEVSYDMIDDIGIKFNTKSKWGIPGPHPVME